MQSLIYNAKVIDEWTIMWYQNKIHQSHSSLLKGTSSAFLLSLMSPFLPLYSHQHLTGFSDAVLVLLWIASSMDLLPVTYVSNALPLVPCFILLLDMLTNTPNPKNTYILCLTNLSPMRNISKCHQYEAFSDILHVELITCSFVFLSLLFSLTHSL